MRAARQKCDILSSQHVGLGCAQSSLPNAPAGCCGVEVELGREMAKGVIRRVFCRCRVSNGLQESQWESTHSHSLLRVINTPRWITRRSLRAISSRTKYFRYRSGSWEVLRDTTKGKARSRAQRTKFLTNWAANQLPIHAGREWYGVSMRSLLGGSQRLRGLTSGYIV